SPAGRPCSAPTRSHVATIRRDYFLGLMWRAIDVQPWATQPNCWCKIESWSFFPRATLILIPTILRKGISTSFSPLNPVFYKFSGRRKKIPTERYRSYRRAYVTAPEHVGKPF